MAETRLKVILDTNIWISFTIGKQMEKLKGVLYNPEVDIFICDEIVIEYNNVIKRPKFRKYVKQSRVSEVNEIILLAATNKSYHSKIKAARDKKDNYLLALAKDTVADYLITGDQDLLVLEKFGNTQVITFSQFLKILNV